MFFNKEIGINEYNFFDIPIWCFVLLTQVYRKKTV